MIDKELGGELVVRMFYARTDAHIRHLQTRSYAEHKALEGFYEEIVGLADGLAESMQGRVGILEYPPEPDIEAADDSLDMLLVLKRWVDSNRDAISDETDIQNQIDEVVTLLSSTYYKIEILK